MTADATGVPVIAGPVEATAIGNILIQALTLGHLKSPRQLRETVEDFFPHANVPSRRLSVGRGAHPLPETPHPRQFMSTTTYTYVNDLWDRSHAATLDPVARLIYRSNLLGSDQRITNTGGGNTSAKLSETDPLTGKKVEVLWVKGSGGDLRTSKRENFSSLYQDKLIALQALYANAPGTRPQDRDRGRHGGKLSPLHVQPEPARARPSTRRCTASFPSSTSTTPIPTPPSPSPRRRIRRS